MAEAILKQQLTQSGIGRDWIIESAGTWAMSDLPMTDEAQAALIEKGIDPNGHHSRIVDRELLRRASVILVMTQNHLESIQVEFPEVAAKTYLLSQLIEQKFDIADPFGGDAQDYRECASGLEQILRAGQTRLQELVESGQSVRS